MLEQKWGDCYCLHLNDFSSRWIAKMKPGRKHSQIVDEKFWCVLCVVSGTYY